MPYRELPGLIPQLVPRLWAFALRICGDTRIAEVLVERACAQALETWPDGPHAMPACGWMLSRIYFIWLEEFSAIERAKSGTGQRREVFIDIPGDASAAATEEAFLWRQVLDAVGSLPADEHLTLLLVVAEQYSHEDTAAVLGVPVDKVMSCVSRARSMVRSTMLASDSNWRVGSDSQFPDRERLRSC
jgi:RNA polymerase sigma-70 factor (ECF subfamily)